MFVAGAEDDRAPLTLLPEVFGIPADTDVSAATFDVHQLSGNTPLTDRKSVV